MERLIEKKENGRFSYYVPIAENITVKMANKLGKFEDFMEEQGFESLEELKVNIEYLKDKVETEKFNYEQLHKFKNQLQQENQALKERWEKLKDFIDTFKEHNIDEANLAWKILDKMKELEV